MSEKKTTIQVGIAGMTCSACSTRIEKDLNKMDGVEATVNLASENASITISDNKKETYDIEEKIKQLGYDVIKEKVDLDIFGMTCAACSTRIEKVLNKMDGVEATVNLASETASIEYYPESIRPREIMERIEKLGYQAKARVSETEKQTFKEKELSRKKMQLIISILLTLPLFYTML
ncbi:MAG TPA: copper ion binding protein, partial [Massilibacterium sp.]|nr:copper ion binding protein [Massilibacterium sp.]